MATRLSRQLDGSLQACCRAVQQVIKFCSAMFDFFWRISVRPHGLVRPGPHPRQDSQADSSQSGVNSTLAAGTAGAWPELSEQDCRCLLRGICAGLEAFPAADLATLKEVLDKVRAASNLRFLSSYLSRKESKALFCWL